MRKDHFGDTITLHMDTCISFRLNNDGQGIVDLQENHFFLSPLDREFILSFEHLRLNIFSITNDFL